MQNKKVPEASSKLLSIKDYEVYASTHMNRDIFMTIFRGSMSGSTLYDNLETFRHYRLMPRHLVPVTGFNSSTTVLGETVSMPIGVASMAWQGMVHPEAENATALAAQALHTVMAVSFYSYVPWDEVADAAPESLRWQQIHLYDDRVGFTLPEANFCLGSGLPFGSHLQQLLSLGY